MTSSRLPPIGFWSYVRRDDELSRRRVSELRDLILAELESQLGQEVPVFKDTVSIPPGARWEEQTTDALSDATFFIPVLTPSFLRSEWCCREVRLFLERQKQLREAYPDLPAVGRIFPIHYIDVTDADARDEEIRDTLMKLQHLNFDGMRHRACDDPIVQTAVAAYVKGICNILRLRVEIADGPLPGVETTRPPTTRTRKARQPRQPRSDDHGLDVILTGHGPSRIVMTKEVQAIAGVTVREAMAIVDGLPWPIARGVSIDQAMKIMARVEAHGGTVELQARMTPAEDDTRPTAPAPEVKPEPVGPLPPGSGQSIGTSQPPSIGPGKSAAILGAIAAVVALWIIIAVANQPSPHGEASNYYADNVASDDMTMDTNMTMNVAANDVSANETNAVANTTDTNMTDTNMVMSAPAATPSPASRQVLFSNTCSKPLELRLIYFRNGTWYDGSGNPWELPANESRYLLVSDGFPVRASDEGFYFQARTTDGSFIWQGGDNRDFGDQTYPMRYYVATISSDGDYLVSVNCPGESR